MSEEKTISLYQQQKAAKPLIEDVVPEIIPDGNVRKAVLDFVAHLRANKMPLRWSGVNSWRAFYKGKGICSIALGNIAWTGKISDFWHVAPRPSHMDDHDESIMNAGLQKIIWNNIKYCNSCGGCAPGREMTISGREFKGICHGLTLIFFDPDETEVEGIKKLLELEKKARDEAAK